MVLNWDRRIGGAIGLWPISDGTAARLTNAQLKESDLTGEMMRPFREAQARHWYVSGIVLRPELAGTRAIRVLLGDGLSHWIYTAAITFPFQLLVSRLRKKVSCCSRDLVSIAIKRLMLCRTVLRFSLSTLSREEFISLLTKSARHPRRSTLMVVAITILRICSRNFQSPAYHAGKYRSYYQMLSGKPLIWWVARCRSIIGGIGMKSVYPNTWPQNRPYQRFRNISSIHVAKLTVCCWTTAL